MNVITLNEMKLTLYSRIRDRGTHRQRESGKEKTKKVLRRANEQTNMDRILNALIRS